VREFVSEMILAEKIAGLYEAIPKAHGTVAFRQLAQQWIPHEYRFPKRERRSGARSQESRSE